VKNAEFYLSRVVLRQTQDIEETERQLGLIRTAAFAHLVVRVDRRRQLRLHRLSPGVGRCSKNRPLSETDGWCPEQTAQCARALDRGRAPCSGRARSCQCSRHPPADAGAGSPNIR
jgi:hypothetical protein